MDDEATLELGIGYRFERKELLLQALTHKSYGPAHNERLEFLGDALLNCCIAAALFRRFPALREGDLSRLRANLVRQESLHALADGMGLGGHLLLGEGELKSGGFRRPSILGDALEAVFGAVYLDGGFAAAESVIGRVFQQPLAQINPAREIKDSKTALQEWLQGRRHPLPRYVLIDTRGEAHAQEFEVECQVDVLGVAEVGRGASRRAAEQEAARRVLDRVSS